MGYLIILNGLFFIGTVTPRRLTIFKASLYNLNKPIEAKDLKECTLDDIVPEQYREFLPLFSMILADRLPPHWPGIDHDVRLKE
jgi:hypothetical protein